MSSLEYQAPNRYNDDLEDCNDGQNGVDFLENDEDMEEDMEEEKVTVLYQNILPK